MARNATDESWGFLDQRRYVLQDRDTKLCASFRATLASGGIKSIQVPARSPNLNAYAERWIRSVKEECLGKLILFGEDSLRRALADFIAHFHFERNHQGKGNVLLFPDQSTFQRGAATTCDAENDWVAFCGSTPAPHELFGHTTICCGQCEFFALSRPLARGGA